MAYLVRTGLRAVDVNELQFIVVPVLVPVPVLSLSILLVVVSSSSSPIPHAAHRLESSVGVEITCRGG